MKRVTKLIARLLAVVLVFSTCSSIVIADTTTVTVAQVIEQLEAIDSLQEMQNKRAEYVSANSYVKNADNVNSVMEEHNNLRDTYETYLDNMFEARLAAKQAYNSLSDSEKAQINPALVEKLNEELDTVFKDKTYAIKPSNNEYNYQVLFKNRLVYEASTYLTDGLDMPAVMVLVDTTDGKTSWTSDGPYSLGQNNYEVAYCSDLDVIPKHGVNYKRINLEDSQLYGTYEAEHIRAIVQNAYPYLTVEEMRAKLKEGGLNSDFVDSLGRSEMIAAVQMAIWTYSNANSKTIGSARFYGATMGLNQNTVLYSQMHDYSNEMWEWWNSKNKTSTFSSEASYRVNTLIHYLCNLEGVKAEQNQVVISNIDVGRVDLVQGSNERYNIGMQIFLNTGVKTGDNVKLHVTSYSTDASGVQTVTDEKVVKMDERKNYPVTINAKYGDSIRVVAEGTQNLEKGVYYYEPEGGASVSQTLVGAAYGKSNVYAVEEFAFEEDIEMGLRIYKKSSIDQKPISDIKFNVYNVEVEDGEVLNENPTDADVEKYAVSENLVGTIVTDNTGYGALALNKGTYLVVEEHNKEKVQAPADPFFITIPWAVEKEVIDDGNVKVEIEYLDVVSVYPKNTPIVPPPPPPPPPPEDVVGQFEIIKYDVDNTSKLLSGAQFAVYRPATDEDTETETITCAGSEYKVVPVTYDQQPLILITDESGSAVSPELTCGVYYLKEVKAPNGYVKLKEAVSVTVESKELQEVTYARIANERGFVLPETGGIGTTLIVIAGFAMTLFAIIAWTTKRRMIEL